MTEDLVFEDRIKAKLASRRRKNIIFICFGYGCQAIVVFCLLFLLGSIVINAIPAMTVYELKVAVNLDSEDLLEEDIKSADFGGLVKSALRDMVPEAEGRKEKKMLYGLISDNSEFELRKAVVENPALIGTVATFNFALAEDFDQLLKKNSEEEIESNINGLEEQQLAYLMSLREKGLVERSFNRRFFTNGDSRDPVQAGILGGVVGSLLVIMVTVAVSLMVGVLTAIYLEEFAPRNFLTNLIEVNINNLASVPSIIFGLLGLAVFINILEMPRASPLLGGMILSLMTIPTIVIASRSAIKSVPTTIKYAALGLGASKMQAVFHQTLPAAMPGILTGSIIGIAQALGETAPLLMIGMVAFIAEIPSSVTEPATSLPVQIFLWANSPEKGFTDKGFLAILALLLFLICVNAFAIFFREKFSRKYKQTQ